MVIGKGKKLSDFLKERRPDCELLELKFEDGNGFCITPENLYALQKSEIMSREIISQYERKSPRITTIVIQLTGGWNH
jgi:hypothetical protein